MLNISVIRDRKEPIKYTKFTEDKNKSNVVKSDKVKLYEYYKCDYCNEEIKLDKKQHERNGGTVVFPHTLTKCGELKFALHNKCLNKVLEQFEK